MGISVEQAKAYRHQVYEETEMFLEAGMSESQVQQNLVYELENRGVNVYDAMQVAKKVVARVSEKLSNREKEDARSRHNKVRGN